MHIKLERLRMKVLETTLRDVLDIEVQQVRLNALLSLVCGGLSVGAALLTKLPGDRLNFTFRPKKEHDDYVNYFEDFVPEFGGSVGVYVVKGKVLNMVEHPDRGLVVVELPDQPLP